MTKCPTDCSVIQEVMHHDESEIEALIEHEKKHGVKCADCEYNDLREDDDGDD